LRYSNKVFGLGELAQEIEDKRQRPVIAMEEIFWAGLVMALGQLGSLNALEQNKKQSYWRRWIGFDVSSADTMGRGFSHAGVDSIRKIIRQAYSRLKRNKAIGPVYAGMIALIIDGHESHRSQLRCCSGCLERRLHTKRGVKREKYHRHVMASLLCEGVCLPLDMEPQRPGEDEVSCAMRLLIRVLKAYPRAFDLILADGLYVRAPFFKLAKKHGKDVIVVLKDERRDLLKDAKGLFKQENPKFYQEGAVERQCWDIEGFTSWEQLGCGIRVVGSLERTRVKRQKTKKIHYESSEWVWASTISKQRLSTEDFVRFGHGRWKIENNGFNELVNYWHADHVYCHNPVAIEAFGLLTMLAYILFHAFIGRNLKAVIRQKYTKKHLAQMITAEIYPCKDFIPP
jgi:hypothetical protein